MHRRIAIQHLATLPIAVPLAYTCTGLAAALGASLLGGCAAMEKENKQRQVASVLSFLYPGKDTPEPPAAQVAEIKVPFRIGVAFVPDDKVATDQRLPETERQVLAGKVREAFASYPFVSRIETVPSLYLEPGGGFANLDRVAALLKLDVIALISYDLVQHADANGWSFLYWTGVGAYVIEGDKFDVLTAVECTVFDVKSRRLLMRASGTARDKGGATLVNFSEKSRAARTKSLGVAVDQMTLALKGEVARFRETAPRDPAIKLVLPPGYDPKAAPAR
jgi:rhombotail lipoprotein